MELNIVRLFEGRRQWLEAGKNMPNMRLAIYFKLFQNMPSFE